MLVDSHREAVYESGEIVLQPIFRSEVARKSSEPSFEAPRAVGRGLWQEIGCRFGASELRGGGFLRFSGSEFEVSWEFGGEAVRRYGGVCQH